MKNILIATLFFLVTSASFALDYQVGPGAKDITPRLLRQYLRKGKGTYEGSRIIYAKGAKVPSNFLQTWNEKKLSGETVPVEGEPGANIIFIKEF